MGRDKILMVNVSGRGDKDMGILTREMKLDGPQMTEAKE